jgi:hypothetical protein
MVLNPVHSQNTNLVKRPSRNPLRELTIPSLELGPSNSLGRGIKPLITQHLCRANQRKPRRVPRLEDRHETKLLARSKQICRVDLLLGVIAIRRRRRPQNRRQQGPRTEDMAHAVREGDHLCGLLVRLPEVFDARAERAGRREDENIMFFAGAAGIVAEMVDYEPGSVGRE